MSSNLRKCKECGKAFLPKGREQYCTDIHYRPCPICGAPVEVKYFSDPPRKCDNCRGKRSSQSQGFKEIPTKILPPARNEEQNSVIATSAVVEPEGSAANLEDVEIVSIQSAVEASSFCEQMTGTVMIYIGKQFKNSFQKGHKYLLKVERSDYVYNVSSAEDITTGETCDIIMPVASQISFYQKFGKVRA